MAHTPLTPEMVSVIKALSDTRIYYQYEIAAMFGINATYVSQIHTRKRFPDVPACKLTPEIRLAIKELCNKHRLYQSKFAELIHQQFAERRFKRHRPHEQFDFEFDLTPPISIH